MSGRVSQSVCTAALAAATVFAAVPIASASPSPVPVPSALPPAVTSGVPSAVPSPSASAAPGGPDGVDGVTDDAPPRTVAEMLTRLQQLYREAEKATEAYNATAAELTRQRAETKRVDSELTRARSALALSRVNAGRLAREQYQGQSGLSGYLRLLLARDPQSALDETYLLARAARGRAETLNRLTGGEQRAQALAQASREALDRQQALATKQKRQRDMVRSRLQEVEKLLASLSRAQITALNDLERAGTDKAQRELLASGALGDGTSPGAGGPQGAGGPAGTSVRKAPSRAGQAALGYAVEQIGKPYEWGAEGPDSFDCSGLTSQAWARAGLTIPRTSQEQWSELPKVSLRELRPGDLVVYFPGATHVAIYLGDGMVIQAPRPGTNVKVSPIAANPLLGAVRPDPEAGALAPGVYEPPALPPGALDGSDSGYGEEAAPEV
ncbi:NlpC/P60 family protein [Streptomyces sp. NPDC056937]|uniref:C40 family peptidase n=1 Tax=Streptomyces sp. NPDC056937 TaxID=3345969 RepID=UPI003629590E